MAMSESFTRYVGPLPVWGWGALGIGGFLLYRHFKASGGTNLGAALGTTSGTGADNTAAQNSGTAAAQEQEDSATSNASWATDAIQYLQSEGYTSSQAQAAIGTYTSGGQLDPSMATLVDNAVQNIGPPPQLIFNTGQTPGAPATTTTSSGAGNAVGSTTTTLPSYVAQHQSAYAQAGATYATGGPKDTSGHQSYFRYTVKKGDTQAKIASMFGTSPKQIESWNKFKTGQSVKAGQTIWV